MATRPAGLGDRTTGAAGPLLCDLAFGLLNDFPCPRLDASVESGEAYSPEPIDAGPPIAGSSAARDQSRDLQCWGMDFADARERVGVGPKPWEAASDLARFSTGVKTHVALVNTQPFGPPRAPAPFGFVAIVLRDLPPPTPEFLFWPKWATFSPQNKLPLRAPLR